MDDMDSNHNVRHDGGNRRGGGDWAARFRMKSAAKRREKEGQQVERGKPISDDDRVSARETDISGWLERQGYSVKREGRHLSVRAGDEEVYRGTYKGDHWVWCDKYGNGIGDNIAIVQDITGADFIDACYDILGIWGGKQVPVLAPAKPSPPKIPKPTEDDIRNGREYLQKRGISAETIKEAEQQGVLRYSGGGVVFCGYDGNGKVRSAYFRATDPAAEVQKRDLKGTDKTYPPIIKGDQSVVWLTEGPVDALAAVDLCRRAGRVIPTIIATGGAGVRRFLENPVVQKILKAAKKVLVIGDNEETPEKQAKIDELHAKQVEEIKKLNNNTHYWKPTDGVKDLAELNQAELARELARRQAAEEARQEAERQAEERREASQGRSMGM